jgi:hypothetical protein
MAAGGMGGDASLMSASRTQRAEPPGTWTHSKFSKSVKGSKKTSICRPVMRYGGTSRHLCILWTAVQVKRLNRQSIEIGRCAGYKWEREYSEMVAFVRTRMALEVIRANKHLANPSQSLSKGPMTTDR